MSWRIDLSPMMDAGKDSAEIKYAWLSHYYSGVGDDGGAESTHWFRLWPAKLHLPILLSLVTMVASQTVVMMTVH